jgi:hypothetical protein
MAKAVQGRAKYQTTLLSAVPLGFKTAYLPGKGRCDSPLGSRCAYVLRIYTNVFSAGS